VIARKRIRSPAGFHARTPFESLVHNAIVAILGVNHEGKITLWNRAATKMFGYNARQAIGKNLHDLIVPRPMRTKARKGFRDFAKTGKGPLVGKTTECMARRRDGSRFPVELSVSAFQQEGHWHATGIVLDITDRQKAHEELAASEEKFRDLATKSLVGIYIIQDNVFKYVNPRMAEIFGYSEKEIINRMEPRQLVHEKDWPTVAGTIRQRIEEKKESVHQSFRGVTKKKKVIEIEAYGSLTTYQGRPAIIGTLLDITKRRQAEKALKAEERRNRIIINTALDAFVSMDDQGLITDWNPRANEMFGWSRKEVLGRSVAETIIPEEFRNAHRKGLEHYLATGKGPLLNRHFETTALHRDGHTFPVELSIVPVHLAGKTSFNAFIHDTSTQHEAKKAMRKSLIGTVVAVARAVGARDPYTAGHQQRVSQLARAIAQEMGLERDRIDGLRLGAIIHDIGKIYLPAEILSRPVKLANIEYELIKSHPQVGYDILKDIPFPWPIAEIAYQHHERLDGSGYPQGLKGEEICLEARIVAVADVVEAICNHRPYRPSLGIGAALEEIESNRGKL